MVLDTVAGEAKPDTKQSQAYSPRRVGVLGGGQLGRMLLTPAARLGLEMHILDPDADCPCAAFTGALTVDDFRDHDAVVAFGRGLDVVTIEIEDVSVSGLSALEAEGVHVYPSPAIILEIQDKGLQKALFDRLSLPTAPYQLYQNATEVAAAVVPGRGFVQKTRRGGYDGKGVKVFPPAADSQVIESMLFDTPSVVEACIDIEKELSIIVARNPAGQVACFPLVEMVFDPVLNLVDFLVSPARVPETISRRAEAYARTLADGLALVGVLAIELFLTKDGELLINEMAPRPHNSGHPTIEANLTSQYEQLLRAICGLPLGDPSARCAAGMLNLIGAPEHTGPPVYDGLFAAMQIPGAYPPLYGKAETRPGRKMGHITLLGASAEAVIAECQAIKRNCRVIT